MILLGFKLLFSDNLFDYWASSFIEVVHVGFFIILIFFLGFNEAKEMSGTMRFVVEFFWISRDNYIFNRAHYAQTYKIVIPNHIVGNHEESHESLRQKQLHFLEIGVSE